MQRGTFGQRVQESGIQKFNMAVGGTSIVVPLVKEIVTKEVAYDEELKRRIEVDEEIRVANPKLLPTKEIYMLVAKLNTDQVGNIVSLNNFDIEYLKFSVSKYNSLLPKMMATPNFTCFYVQKTEKHTNDGKSFTDFSYDLSCNEIPQEITAKIQKLVNTQGAIDGLFNMVDLATSTPKATYLQLLNEASLTRAIGATTTATAQPIAQTFTGQSVAQTVTAQPLPQPNNMIPQQPQQVAPQPQQVAPQPQQVAQPQSFATTSAQSLFGGELNDDTKLPF